MGLGVEQLLPRVPLLTQYSAPQAVELHRRTVVKSTVDSNNEEGA